MDELTKKALQEKNKQTKPDTPQKIQETETKETKENEQSFQTADTLENNTNEIILNKDKIVKVKPWTGKTKKKFRKIFEYVNEIEDINFEEVVNVLIYDCIDKKPSEIYLNEGEQQVLLSILTQKSIADEIVVQVECTQCGVENDIRSNVLKDTHFKPSNFPKKLSSENGFSKEMILKDIDSYDNLKKTVQEITTSDDYDGVTTAYDIETAMHIEIGDLNTKQIIEELDNTTTKELDKIFKTLQETLPECKIYQKRRCKKCKKVETFEIDYTTKIFESLLK